MAYKFFRIPARGCEFSEQELNRFLAGHCVLSVTREFTAQGDNSFWCFCVDYLEGGSPKETPRRTQIDYRETLEPEEFAVFDELRELRKVLARDEAVPVYAIFTNEQLARIVRRRAGSLADLKRIPRLGEARIEKYGARLLAITNKHWGGKDSENETSSGAV